MGSWWISFWVEKNKIFRSVFSKSRYCIRFFSDSITYPFNAAVKLGLLYLLLFLITCFFDVLENKVAILISVIWSLIRIFWSFWFLSISTIWLNLKQCSRFSYPLLSLFFVLLCSSQKHINNQQPECEIIHIFLMIFWADGSLCPSVLLACVHRCLTFSRRIFSRNQFLEVPKRISSDANKSFAVAFHPLQFATVCLCFLWQLVLFQLGTFIHM